jgi:hypothetical protein
MEYKLKMSNNGRKVSEKREREREYGSLNFRLITNASFHNISMTYKLCYNAYIANNNPILLDHSSCV